MEYDIQFLDQTGGPDAYYGFVRIDGKSYEVAAKVEDDKIILIFDPFGFRCMQDNIPVERRS
jgi:hypothetical protein